MWISKKRHQFLTHWLETKEGLINAQRDLNDAMREQIFGLTNERDEAIQQLADLAFEHEELKAAMLELKPEP